MRRERGHWEEEGQGKAVSACVSRAHLRELLGAQRVGVVAEGFRIDCSGLHHNELDATIAIDKTIHYTFL